MNPFATHIPALLACLEHTSGPVLELGSGWFSTPIVSASATDLESLSSLSQGVHHATRK